VIGHHQIIEEIVRPTPEFDTAAFRGTCLSLRRETFCTHQQRVCVRTGDSGSSLAHDISMRSGVRVLVADDDPQLLEVVSDALMQLGVDVTRAADGAELIENLAAKGPFDLIVADIAMPWMTGVQALHAARTAGLGTSVLVITALRDETLFARVKALGENAALLHKPFAIAELESAVSTLLAQSTRESTLNNGPDVGSRKVPS
jgi:CheY-like chemotaxis protein